MSLHKNKPSISGAFTAVAVYGIEGELPGLANFRRVLDALSERRKEGLVLAGFESAGDSSDTYISGKNKLGYAISFIAASDDTGKKTFMPVIFDRLQDKTLVLGPAKLQPGAMRALRNAGVTYVNKGDGKAVDKMNDFLVSTAWYRGDRGLLDPESAVQVVEDMVIAIRNSGAVKGGQREIGGRETIGSLLVEGTLANVEPNAYVAAAKPKTHSR